MDVETHLDPEIAAALAGSPFASFDFGSFDVGQLPALRETLAAMPRPPIPPTTTMSNDVVVPGPPGAPDVTLRISRPPGDATGRPCIYWIPGGGYIIASALVDDARINRWCEEFDCVVVSVEYRLAPEAPYPAPLDDCYAGLVWTARHATELGIDARRIAIAGASAGGGLAAGLALQARDRAEVDVCYQLLIYPMIDDRNATPSSRLSGVPIWSRDANLLGWRCYLGGEPGAADVPAYAAASRASDLSGLPPGFICVGTLDVFRDEDIDYALRLLAAGVPTELHVYPGAPHGFESILPTAAVSRRCQRDIDDALRAALTPRTAVPASG